MILRACLLMALCGDGRLAAIFKGDGQLCQLSEHVFVACQDKQKCIISICVGIKKNREGTAVCMMY